VILSGRVYAAGERRARPLPGRDPHQCAGTDCRGRKCWTGDVLIYGLHVRGLGARHHDAACQHFWVPRTAADRDRSERHRRSTSGSSLAPGRGSCSQG
jgi:hypothetical protein